MRLQITDPEAQWPATEHGASASGEYPGPADPAPPKKMPERHACEVDRDRILRFVYML